MTFDDIEPGERIFLDANILVYYFAPYPTLGVLCGNLIKRVNTREVSAFTSTHILTEVAHRLMVVEASQKFGWESKVVDHLKRQPTALHALSTFKNAIEKVPELGIELISIPGDVVADGASKSIQYGLLSNDALTVAVMQANALTNIASNDADFDRVPWMKRFAPL